MEQWVVLYKWKFLPSFFIFATFARFIKNAKNKNSLTNFCQVFYFREVHELIQKRKKKLAKYIPFNSSMNRKFAPPVHTSITVQGVWMQSCRNVCQSQIRENIFPRNFVLIQYGSTLLRLRGYCTSYHKS